jgi:hypothetical protein
LEKNVIADLLLHIKNVEDWRVLTTIKPLLSCEKFAAIEQNLLAEKMGMRKMHINRCLKRLVISSYLLEGPRIGRNRGYKLNPYYDWEGQYNLSCTAHF